MNQTFYRSESVLRQACGLVYQSGLSTVTSMHPKEWVLWKNSAYDGALPRVSMLSSQAMTEEEKRMYEIEMRNTIIAQGNQLGW